MVHFHVCLASKAVIFMYLFSPCAAAICLLRQKQCSAPLSALFRRSKQREEVFDISPGFQKHTSNFSFFNATLQCCLRHKLHLLSPFSAVLDAALAGRCPFKKVTAALWRSWSGTGQERTPLKESQNFSNTQVLQFTVSDRLQWMRTQPRRFLTFPAADKADATDRLDRRRLNERENLWNDARATASLPPKFS